MATSDESRFERLLDQASDAAFLLDPLEDRILTANPAGCAMVGYTLEELLDTPISRIHPGELPQLRDFVSRVLRKGHGSTIALTCRTRSGQFLPTEMTVWASGGGPRAYVLALIRDRSEHRARAAPSEPRLRPRTAATATLDGTDTPTRKEQRMVTTGLMVRLEAKAGKEEELASFLVDALPLVQEEPETVAWLAIRADASSFAIVDVFRDEAGRRAHLVGAVATALSERASELLAEPPNLEQVEVLAAKLP